MSNRVPLATFWAASVVVLLVTASCTPGSIVLPGTPEYAVKGFAQAMSAGNSDKALDYICRAGSGIVTILPTLHFDWRNDTYTVASKSGQAVAVRMQGESRVTRQDWEKWDRDLQLQVPQLFSARVFLDYTWNLSRENNGWCVPEAELSNFVTYFIQSVQQEVPQ